MMGRKIVKRVQKNNFRPIKKIGPLLRDKGRVLKGRVFNFFLVKMIRVELRVETDGSESQIEN